MVTSCLGGGLLDPVCQGIGGIGSAVFGAGATAALDAMASWVSSGSTWLLGQIAAALAASTQISLSAPWFLTRYRSMEGILALFALPMLVATAIQALIQQRASLLVRAALVQLPLAMLLAGAAVQLTTMALAVTDQLCTAVAGVDPGALGALTTSLARSLMEAGAASGSGAPAFVVLLCALLVAIAALVLWVELVLRAAAVYVGVLFLPLALACTVWPALTTWCRRLVETIAALILAKLVVVVVLEAAVGALGTSQGRGFATVVTGIALLFLATMAPFTLLKLLPMFESTAALHLEGLRQRGSAAMMSGLPRQGAAIALDAARATPPLAVPAALVAAGRAAQGAVSQLDEVGERSTASPMESSAVTRDVGPTSPPTTDAASSGSGAGHAAAAAAWPSPEHPVHGGVEAPRSTPSARRPTSLYLDRDEWGPVIRQRPATGDEA